MLGYEPGDLPPEYKSWADLLHPDDRARTELAVQRHVDGGEGFTVEFRLRGRDGRWLWISSSGKIVERDSKGSALRIVGTHVDISERKRTQAELEQANQNLERRVSERTRDLAALYGLAAVEARGGVKVDLEVEGSESLTPRVRQELYQIAQEALNNALRHARAQSVRILLDFRGSETCLEVSDDGCGFEPEGADRSGGFGLRGMRERVQQIGGTLRVESSPGKGTTIQVAVPAGQAAR